MRQRLEEMDVYKRAQVFTAAIAAILDRPQARRNRDLHEQLSRANDSIMANMEEGYEQSTDRGFARYLFTSKGSLAEALGWLRRARRRGIISEAELTGYLRTGDEIGKCSAVHSLPRRIRLPRPRPVQVERPERSES